MEYKVVTQATHQLPRASSSDKLLRALDILISKNGVFKSSEKWVIEAFRPLIDNGILKYSEGVFTAANNVEDFLISASKHDERFVKLHSDYRQLVLSSREAISGTDSDLIEKLDHFATVDEQLSFLCSEISYLSAEVTHLTEIVNSCVALLNEYNTSLNVLEAVVYDENTNS